MEIINFTIDDKFILDCDKNFNFSIKKFNTNINVIGEVIGAIIDNNVYNATGFKDYLNNHFEDIDLIKKLVRNSIGAFYLVINCDGNTHVLCSYSSPGLLYKKKNNKLYFSNSERDIFKKFGKISNINQEILLNTVISHQILLRPPFSTLFDDIYRLPSATGLIINQDLNFELDIQLANEIPDSNYKALSIEESVQRFEFLIENTLRLIANYHIEQNKKLELFFSGGIDSSVLMIALKKIGINFFSRHNAYNGAKSRDVTIAKKIAKKLDAKLFIQYKTTSPDLKNLINISKSGLGTNVTPYQLTSEVTAKAFGYEDTINIISGQNLDTLYHVDAFAPGSSNLLPIKILHIVYFLRDRILYSDFFLSKNKKKWILKFWPFSVKQKNLDADFKQFIESICIPIKEHTTPLEENINENDTTINKIVKKNKIKNLFLPIYNYFLKNNYKLIFQNLTSIQKISVIKIFRWYRTVNNVAINQHNLQIGTNINRLIPFQDGPLANFFLKKNLSLSEMFFIKRIMYKYFKNKVGLNYSYFCKSASTSSFILLFKFLFIRILRTLKLIKVDKSKNTFNYYNELNILKNIRLSEKKILLDLVSNKNIKIYLDSLYKNLDEPNNRISKDKMMCLCRLVNIENMLHLIK